MNHGLFAKLPIGAVVCTGGWFVFAGCTGDEGGSVTVLSGGDASVEGTIGDAHADLIGSEDGKHDAIASDTLQDHNALDAPLDVPADACTTGTKLCAAACVLTNDPAHGCGAALCDPCSVPNATAGCAGGVCSVASCLAGWADCDGAQPGCETNAQTDPNHCGVCTKACAAAEQCQAAVCVLQPCGSGLGDCDSNPANGCEANLNTDASNCGFCNNVCGGVHATPGCQAGNCTVTCDQNFDDCDSNPATGCEADLQNDVNHCGGCNRPCVVQNGQPNCVGGNCQVVCTPPWNDCDADHTNCEVDTNSDPNHCGGCNACNGGANATAVCVAGSCDLQCNPGFGNCDNNLGNGCEVNTTTDKNNCGSCGNGCADPLVCAAGSCTVDPTGLILHLDSENPASNTGTAQWLDLSGHNHHFTHSGTPSYTPGSGFFFDASDYCDGPIAGWPAGSSDRTVVAWATPVTDNGAAFYHAFQYGSPNNLQAFGLVRMASGAIGAHLWGQAPSAGSWALSEQAMVGVRLSSTNLHTFFKNGAAVGSDSTITPATQLTDPARVGSRIGATAEQFFGFVRVVWVYQRALSDQEILALYNLTK